MVDAMLQKWQCFICCGGDGLSLSFRPTLAPLGIPKLNIQLCLHILDSDPQPCSKLLVFGLCVVCGRSNYKNWTVAKQNVCYITAYRTIKWLSAYVRLAYVHQPTKTITNNNTRPVIQLHSNKNEPIFANSSLLRCCNKLFKSSPTQVTLFMETISNPPKHNWYWPMA